MSKISESQKQFLDSVAIWLKTQLEKNDNPKQSEIELRFGHCQSFDNSEKTVNFVNGIGVAEWHRIREALACTETEAQSKPPQTVLEIIKIYENSSKTQTLRSIEHADGTKTNQCKINVAQRNFQFNDATCGTQVAGRLSHSVELPHDIDIVTTTPILIRARARTTFWHRMWRIDLSQVQQGADEDAVEMAPALFEVEIELLQDRIDWSKHDYHYIALALLVKVGEILNFMKEKPKDTVELPKVCPL